jgi:hypothetical protein
VQLIRDGHTIDAEQADEADGRLRRPQLIGGPLDGAERVSVANVVDTPLESIGFILFFASLAVGVFWGIYGFVELRWLRRLDARGFVRGPTIWHLRDPALSALTTPSAEITHTASARLRLLSPGMIAFSPPVHSSFGLGALWNLLVFKALLNQHSGELVVRAPAGTSWFLASWMIAWLVFGAFLLPDTECSINGIVHPAGSRECLRPFLMSIPIVFAFEASLVWLTRRRASRALQEIQTTLGGAV